MSGNIIRLELFAFQATQILERGPFLQFMGELYQRQLYPGPIVFAVAPPTPPLRVDLGITWE